MKVIQVSKFYPPIRGGIESVAWELTEGLNRAGVRADVLCANQAPRTVRERAPLGYEIVRAASIGRLMSTSVALPMVGLLRTLSRGCDLIHIHMPDPMAAAALWAARPQARVVVHWHSDVVRQRVAMWAYEPLQRWVLQRADAIIATSQAYADSSRPLKPWLPKVEVVPIGISDNRGSSSSERAAAIRRRLGARRIVFALGRMTYYKGFDVLIDAARSLPDDCSVVIGGDGELCDYYRQLVKRKGLESKVHLTGHIPDHELASYFEACDVFCLPSTLRAEAYGVAMVEAMAMGKPVVASDIGGSGVPWVNQHGRTGLNVPVHDSGALADAIGVLLRDADRCRILGEGARERYQGEFSARQMTERTLQMYRRLVPAGAA